MFGKNNVKQKHAGIVDNDADFIPMHTAEEMYNYCITHKFGSGTIKSWALKHFQIIEDNLMRNETVYMTFIGLHNYKSSTSHDKNFAYAITDKRIMIAQKQPLGKVFQTVNISNINDITFSSGILMGILTIDTYKEVFNVGLGKDEAENINSLIHIVIDKIKSDNNKPAAPESPRIESPAPSAADELLKYKGLLDAGAITQEEYDAKKKQLLGL
ncbi:PH domain-containing protein [Caproicibacterium sp. BJN0003]|uniref:PH domain-containing protein n=1 Tax=Caproicibacterium sp. BJN0003 TaxID=2994078 RepID=UPI0022548A2A|nr:PH domain-containing protein [Caproicibacterium sp. BJN0003]UZT82107.1 SHOCT domain-containing protein [Caproicibacterium sp. BJN0003]